MSVNVGKIVGYSCWLLAASLLLQACGGGGDSDRANTVEATGATPVVFIKRAGVSTYAGSTVEIEYYDSMNGWQAVTSLPTSDTGTLMERGLFDLRETTFLADSWYRFTVSGGVNQDADMDGAIDAEASEVNGRLRSLAKGDWLQAQGGSHISAATEFAYTSLHKLLVEEEIDWAAVETALNAAAGKLLVNDQTGDGEVSGEDLLAQDPQSLYDNLHFFQRNQLPMLNELVEAGISSQLTGTLNDKVFGARTGGGYEIVMDSDGRMIYAAVSRDGVLIYDPETGEETEVATGISLTRKLALSEDRGLLFVVAGSDGIKVIDLVTQSLIDPLLSSYGYVYDVAVSPDESVLYAATGDGLLVYDIDAGTYEEFLTDYCETLTLSEDGSRLGMGCYSGIKVYDVAAGEISHEIALASAAHTVLFEGDAAYVANEGDGLTIVDLVSGDYDSYAVPNGESLKTIAPHADADTLAVFSYDDNYTFDLSTRTYGSSLFPEFTDSATDYVFYSSRYDTYLFDYYALAGGVLKTADVIDVIDDSNYIYNVGLNASAGKVFYSDYYGTFGVYTPETGALESYSLAGDVGGFAVNAEETTAYVVWRNSGFFVVDLTDGSYLSVDLDKGLAYPLLDENAGLLYIVNYGVGAVETYSLTDNSLVETLDLGTCDPIFLRLSEVENALDVSCKKNGIKRMDLDAGSWAQIMNGNYLYSFDYNDDESLMYIQKNANLVIHDMATDTEVKSISHSGANANMIVFSTTYWPEMNAVIIGGNPGARFVSLETEKHYWLHDEFGNDFALDSTSRQLYLAAGNDAGLMVLDMSDFE